MSSFSCLPESGGLFDDNSYLWVSCAGFAPFTLNVPVNAIVYLSPSRVTSCNQGKNKTKKYNVFCGQTRSHIVYGSVAIPELRIFCDKLWSRSVPEQKH